jgi:ubiquinone/menaquinone biosynthesis C-methylase UbiE
VEPGLVFDRVAAEYDRVRPGYPPELVDAALAGLEARRVLEVGCGTGKLTEALAARGLEVEAVEPGSNLAELARRRAPALRVHAGRFEDVDLPEAEYDALFSATAFHWVDPDVGWEKAASVLRPGGRIALLTHVFVTNPEIRPAQERLRDAYGASWTFIDEAGVREAGVRDRHNISELWASLTACGSNAKAAELFGEARLETRPVRTELDADALLAFQRTTSTHLTLPPERVAEVEAAIVELVASLGGRYTFEQLAVLAVADRR